MFSRLSYLVLLGNYGLVVLTDQNWSRFGNLLDIRSRETSHERLFPYLSIAIFTCQRSRSELEDVESWQVRFFLEIMHFLGQWLRSPWIGKFNLHNLTPFSAAASNMKTEKGPC